MQRWADRLNGGLGWRDQERMPNLKTISTAAQNNASKSFKRFIPKFMNGLPPHPYLSASDSDNLIFKLKKAKTGVHRQIISLTFENLGAKILKRKTQFRNRVQSYDLQLFDEFTRTQTRGIGCRTSEIKRDIGKPHRKKDAS